MNITTYERPMLACKPHASQGTSEKTKVKFDYNCCQEHRRLVWEAHHLNSLSEDISKESMEIGIFKTDLNEDKKIDFISYTRSKHSCGSSGCAIAFFLQTDEENYIKVSGPSNSYENISVSNNSTNNMRDLFFAGRQENEHCLWQWNGKSYQFINCAKMGE